MKADLATSILAATIGVVVAYVVCNLFLPPLEPVNFKTLSATEEYNKLTSPEDDVFNFRALNPTVEVYVGECKEYDANGECVEDVKAVTEEETTEETPEAETENGEN